MTQPDTDFNQIRSIPTSESGSVLDSAREGIRLAEAATKGPWLVETILSDTGGEYITGHVVSPNHKYAGNKHGKKNSVTGEDSMTARDADLIAHCGINHGAICEALLTVAKALKATLESGLGRHDHWDSTMMGGVGCPICIEQRKAAEIARAALAKIEGT